MVIQNGIGYDDFMTKIESASPNPARQGASTCSTSSGLPDSTPNPHLWYDPTTMPKVADALAADYAALQPAHAAYFRANAATFIASLNPWLQALADFKAQYAGTPVATTEPVADYMLTAAGADNLTPFRFQADIMNGVDPSPQDVSLQTALFTQHKVKVFVYNQQVTDALTQSFITRRAGRAHTGDRRVRDDADSGLHVSVVDACRGERAAEGGGRRRLDAAACDARKLAAADDSGRDSCGR